MPDYTVIANEGDVYPTEWPPGQLKAHSWRWENETTIHLPDGREFANINDARGANGPQWVEVRRPTADTRPAVERDPASAVFVRSLYTGYFHEEPDAQGWNFWTQELINGRQTRASLDSVFANDAKAVAWRAAHPATVPPVVVTPGTGGGGPVVTVPPVIAVGGGILDGKLFGVDKKILLLGAVAAYFLTSK